MIQVRLQPDGFRLSVRVTPKGGRSQVLGFQAGDTEVRLKVSAPPEDGKANSAVIQLLADILKLAKRDIEIAHGEQSRHKQVKVRSQAPDEALQRLAQAMGCPESSKCFQFEVSPPR